MISMMSYFKVCNEETLVQCVMFYEAETWTINRVQEGKLRATELDFWRRSARKSRRDKIKNVEIKQIMNVEKDIVEVINGKRLQRYGHILKMNDGKLPKEVMRWTPEGTNRKGRPNENWMEGMRRCMGLKELQDVDALNREQWREKIR
mgnify:CR=1 FL=1